MTQFSHNHLVPPVFSSLEIRDVTLRDGLQQTGKLLLLDRKISIVRSLLALGVPSLEIGSMARPDLVPSTADTIELIEALTPAELMRCWVWVATPRHVERAIAAGAINLQYCLSASDAHNQANIARSVESSLDHMPSAIQLVHIAGGRIQLCIATSFTCPIEGPIPESRVLEIANDARTEGADEIVICDTLGQAIPTQVAHLVTRVRQETPDRRIVFHGHDTWGQGMANSLAAAAAGAAMVDGSLGGLGGCPFAAGASGNTSTEDLAFGTRPPWLNPAGLVQMVEIGEGLSDELAEPNRSKTAQGVRSVAKAFEWVAGPRTLTKAVI